MRAGGGGGGHHNTLPKFGRECTTLLSIQIRATIVVRLDGVQNDVADFDSRSIVLEIDNLLDVYGDARECDAADFPI